MDMSRGQLASGNSSGLPMHLEVVICRWHLKPGALIESVSRGQSSLSWLGTQEQPTKEIVKVWPVR